MSEVTMSDPEVLRAPHVLEFPYSRSVGRDLGAFFTGLVEGRVLGASTRGSPDRVVVPAREYDPITGEDTDGLVEVGPGGVVTAWGWTDHPLEGQPLQRPFAWALVVLDGASNAILHVVDSGSHDAMSTGMRVVARFRDPAARVGSITDIECFVPEGSAPQADRAAGVEPVTVLSTPIRLDYTFSAGIAQSSFLRGLSEGRFLGQRCPRCGQVYVPPRGSCPTDGVPTTDVVELPDTGTVTTYCVVNVPFQGQAIELPYVCAQVLLDGANISFMHLIQGIPADQVRMGLRVRAVWVDRDDLVPSMESVRYFEPTGEPDAPYESYEEYL